MPRRRFPRTQTPYAWKFGRHLLPLRTQWACWHPHTRERHVELPPSPRQRCPATRQPPCRRQTKADRFLHNTRRPGPCPSDTVSFVPDKDRHHVRPGALRIAPTGLTPSTAQSPCPAGFSADLQMPVLSILHSPLASSKPSRQAPRHAVNRTVACRERPAPAPRRCTAAVSEDEPPHCPCPRYRRATTSPVCSRKC